MKPSWVRVAHPFAWGAFTQEEDIRHHARALALEGIGGEADRPEEIRAVGKILADARILLVEHVMGGHEGQDAAGFHGVHGFGEEEIMQR